MGRGTLRGNGMTIGCLVPHLGYQDLGGRREFPGECVVACDFLSDARIYEIDAGEASEFRDVV